jgi:site-specific DNA-methyltransferase (adenine-specific)
MKITDKLTITNEDNMELMARYPDNYFDLAIVDPPYGLGTKTTDGGSKKNSQTKFMKDIRRTNWDNATPSEEYFIELNRVSKNQIIWGGNYMAEHIGNTKCILIWDKMTYIPTMSQFEFAFCSMNKHPQLIKINSNDINRQHPTQKPIDLYKWILDTYAVCKTCKNEHGYFEDVAGDGGSKIWQPCEDCYHEQTGTNGFKILDTHLGSGSIAIACHDYGFELTACELDKEYYDKAVQRIKNHVSQQKLF